MKNAEKVTESPHYEALVKFLAGVNAKVEAYWDRNGFTFAKAPKVAVTSVGPRYAKLASHDERNGEYKVSSVYCFFDFTTGDLYKGTWKAPVANGKRGNVNDANILNRFTEHGPAYL